MGKAEARNILKQRTACPRSHQQEEEKPELYPSFLSPKDMVFPPLLNV